MPNELNEVMRQVLDKITPTEAERKCMEALAKNLELKVSAACEEFSLEAIVRVEGSVAKNTWLKGDPDVDVFMRLSPSIPRKVMGDISLKVARKATEGAIQVERFAEHPYLEAFVDDTRVNIVPCYDVKPGEWLSATDRTPYHTDYINQHMDEALRSDVRLLKKFMKGVGVYGAEIKVGGFSGYLCELLVLHFGSFVKVLEALAKHVSRRVVDIEGYYEKRQRELELLFPEPLVFIDPVDKARNVASAVQPQRLHILVASSRAFLAKPNIEFFYPLKVHPLSVEELRKITIDRGSSLLFLTVDKIDAVPDILWGQLIRTRKSLRKQLELNDFKVLRDEVWTEDKAEFMIFVFEIEQNTLPDVKKHLGPPLEFQRECDSFLAKYAMKSEVLSGPFIENGRWMVELRRKNFDAAEFLRAKLSSGGKDIGVAELISDALRENFLVLRGDEVIEHYAYSKEFAGFLTGFLLDKPFWLEP
jgi:tRNA nucleotidyltransferase (CCA-adding enzyme)